MHSVFNFKQWGTLGRSLTFMKIISFYRWLRGQRKVALAPPRIEGLCGWLNPGKLFQRPWTRMSINPSGLLKKSRQRLPVSFRNRDEEPLTSKDWSSFGSFVFTWAYGSALFPVPRSTFNWSSDFYSYGSFKLPLKYRLRPAALRRGWLQSGISLVLQAFA